MMAWRPPLSHVLEMRARADRQAAAAGAIGRGDFRGAVDDAGGREIRARHVLHELRQRDVRIVDHREAGVDDFAQVVRRDVGRHAHGDAGGAVDQQVREARRQHRRLGLRAVVVGHEVDGFLLDVGQQLAARCATCALRCNAWPPARRRPPSRSCPARPPAGSAWRSPAPCAPARRTPRCRRAGGTCR